MPRIKNVHLTNDAEGELCVLIAGLHPESCLPEGDCEAARNVAKGIINRLKAAGAFSHKTKDDFWVLIHSVYSLGVYDMCGEAEKWAADTTITLPPRTNLTESPGVASPPITPKEQNPGPGLSEKVSLPGLSVMSSAETRDNLEKLSSSESPSQT